jgi:hypothetical protein
MSNQESHRNAWAQQRACDENRADTQRLQQQHVSRRVGGNEMKLSLRTIFRRLRS